VVVRRIGLGEVGLLVAGLVIVGIELVWKPVLVVLELMVVVWGLMLVALVVTGVDAVAGVGIFVVIVLVISSVE
jgi:hypothetical protein